MDDENAAWHAGAVNNPSWNLYDGTNPNRYTLGIEHECLEGGELTEVQYRATLWLHIQLIAKWGMPIDCDHIIGHYRIDSVNRPNCPGPNFPWEKLFADLKGENEVLADIKVIVKGQEITGKVINNVTYVPVRELIEVLNNRVGYDAVDKVVTIK